MKTLLYIILMFIFSLLLSLYLLGVFESHELRPRVPDGIKHYSPNLPNYIPTYKDEGGKG